ncbi:glucosidase II beta subunit-like-domain-containing protein, partial [Gorgonomyces haynaldii]
MIFVKLVWALKGVDPSDTRYQVTDYFECDGTKIPIQSLNDDYCDCLDGTDEPGTSACQNGTFYCLNKGHIGQTISSSRVNDGICDPECCDGSDELHCPNVCDQVHKKYQREQDQKNLVLRKGGQAKRKLIEQANNQRTVKVKELEARIEKLSQKEKRAEEEKTKAEQLEQQHKQLKEEEHQKQCPAKFTSLQQEYESLMETTRDLESRLKTVYDALADLESTEKDSIPYLKTLYADNRQFVEELEISDADPTLLEPFEPAENPCEGSLWQCFKHASTLFITRAVESNSLLQLLSPLSEKSEPVDPQKARDRLYEIQEKKRKVQQELDDLSKQDKIDFGPEMEWDALYHKCFEFDTTEYVYELCLFGEAKQKAKSGGNVGLGTFTRWGDRKNQKSYHKMMYENGLQCWNGPQRSVEVEFICGIETRIISQGEPNVCEYTMKVETPAACPTWREDKSEL